MVSFARQYGEFAIVSGEGFEYIFNTHYGYIKKLNDYLKSPLKLSVWKAPTDNDRVIKNKWLNENYDKMYNKVYNVSINGNKITVKGGLAAVSRMKFFDYTAIYTLYADGQIDILRDGDFDVRRTFLPRLGFECTVDEKEFSMLKNAYLYSHEYL